MITRLSASAVDTFDASTPFGCARKGHFQYVQGLRAPQDPSAELGEQVHATIEHYLKTGINGLHPIALAGKRFIEPYANGRRITVEHRFGPDVPGVALTAHGIPFAGRIDLLAERVPGDDPHHEILDWKTTSNINRYAKTIEQARTSTQMVTYWEWFYRQVPEFQDPIRGTFVYFQTRGNASERVTTVADREFVAKRWTIIEGMVKNIIDVANEPRIEKVEPNLRACDIARGCPFRSRCPRADPLGIFDLNPQSKEMHPVMSLLDRFKMPAPAPVPLVAPPPEKKHLLIADVPEPAATAPESAPAGAQAPAPAPVPPPEKFEPVPPPKRGPGRPKKTEVKETEFVTPAANAKPEPGGVTSRRVTHGVTVNLGNYQSARFEVTLEGTMPTEALGAACREDLEREVKAFLKVGSAEALAAGALVKNK